MTITASGLAGKTVGDAISSLARSVGSVTSGRRVALCVTYWNDTGVDTLVAGDLTKTAGTSTIGTIVLEQQNSVAAGGSAYIHSAIFRVPITGSGTLTLTLAGISAGSYVVLFSEEFNASGGWDATTEATNGAAVATDGLTTFSSGNATSAGGALFIGSLLWNTSGSAALSPLNSFTTIGIEDDGNNHIPGAASYRIVTTGTTTAAAWNGTADGASYNGACASVVVWKEAAGASGAITGSAALAFGAGSSTTTGSGALAGSAAEVFGAGSSTLRGTGALAGSSALTFAAGSSALTGAGALAGSAANVFDDGASTLTGAGSLIGSSALVFGETAALTGAGALAGSSAMVFGGSLALSGDIVGASDITITPTGTLTGAGALAGTAALSFANTATLAGAGALAGSAALAFANTGTLTGAGALAGSSALAFTTAGDLTAAASGAMEGAAAMSFGAGSSTLTGSGALLGASAMAFLASLRTPDATVDAPSGAGRARGKRRHRYVVEIDGEEFEVSSPEAAEALLEQAKALARQKAEEAISRAQKATRRPKPKILADARKSMPMPEIKASEAIEPAAQSTIEDIRAIYREAMQAVEMIALMRRADQEEEEAVLLLLM